MVLDHERIDVDSTGIGFWLFKVVSIKNKLCTARQTGFNLNPEEIQYISSW